MPLITEPNLPQADAVYECLIAAHAGLCFDDSAKLNARLILLLFNHIGDGIVLHEAIQCAKNSTCQEELTQ